MKRRCKSIGNSLTSDSSKDMINIEQTLNTSANISSSLADRVIDLAHINQLNEIIDIFRECKKNMENENIFQWTDNYPNTNHILQNINDGSLFSLTQGDKCVGVITIDNFESPEYKSINWQDKNGKILVIHRLAVHPLSQKQGFAKEIMDFAENFAFNNGFTSIRLDAFRGNPRALKFYENRGYEKRGEVNFPGKLSSIPFICFEKYCV